MPSIYDYATGPDAELGPPPDAWVLRGQASNLPYIAGFDNWLSRGILDVIEPIADHYDTTDSGSWLADTIYPMAGYVSGDITGIYLSRGTSPGTVGVRLHTKGNDLQLFVEESGGTDRHNWLFKDDGTLQIANTLGVYGFLAGLDATSKLRYGYASTYPTFRMDFDVIRGGWTTPGPTSTSVIDWNDSGSTADLYSTHGSSATATAVCPLQLSFDLGRTTETVYELMELTGRINVAGSATGITVDVMRRSATDLTGYTSIMSIASVSGTSATVTSTTGAPIVLDTSQYVYQLRITVAGAGTSTANKGQVDRLYLKIRKRAVE